LDSSDFYWKKQGGNAIRDGKKINLGEEQKDLNNHIRVARTFLLNYMPFELTMDNYEEILEKYFVYIGIVEDYQTSINLLADKLGFPHVKVNKTNTSPRNEKVSEEVKEEFIKKHPLEYAIYNFALKNYQK
jgi:hypothetical protein